MKIKKIISKYRTQVYFALNGKDFNPKAITKMLQIEPTQQGRRGEKGRYIPEQKHSYWQIATEKGKEYLDIPMLVQEIVVQLSSKVEIINSIKEKYQLDSILQIVLDIDVDENISTPILNFDNDVIESLYQTKTEMDIDIYRK